ncbi:MAG: ArsR family transcriptional regulator, arsenate/arsenite/antimonite-responsive transcriptional [Frankiaceae bacterium]|jgi:DNA-binding transcriptional ArsR family regulator|nr:ArsR family transcriptional regulator, arsenate/arsenite/antimonite-responsive transcriptional [Frankiaceae bacterium]MDQ1727794.1 ArsR family transcriptional regulator, arsenate/arsenite/antimonite-responsive transcriptional [Frankiaceae bacterium]
MPKSLPLVDARAALCCAPLSAGALSESDALAVAKRFKAVGDPVRVRLLSLLAAGPDDGCCTCDLAPAVGVGEATVSHHLKKLLEAGLVTKRRDGLNVYYRPVPEALEALAGVLMPASTLVCR